MAKPPAGSGFRCTECGWQSAKWTGRCGECQAWGTVLEAVLPRQARGTRVRASVGVRSAVHSLAPASTAPLPIGQVDATDATARPSGMDELDRVLGGGLVPGAVLLLAGEPGVGKSTLLLEAGALVAASGPGPDLPGEESSAPGGTQDSVTGAGAACSVTISLRTGPPPRRVEPKRVPSAPIVTRI